MGPMPSTPTPLSTGPRQRPRLKFIWGAHTAIMAEWRLGLFGFYAHSPGFPRSGLAISVRGLLGWLLTLGILSYVGAAFVLTRVLQHDAYNQIGFSDVLSWPVQRSHVAQLRAKGWLVRGKAAFQKGQWSDAVLYLRRGLALVPEDQEARLALCQFYVMAGRRAKALELMREGLAPPLPLPPRRAVEVVLEMAFDGEDWTSALDICDRLLPRLNAPEQWGYGQWLLSRKLEVLIATQRSGEALALAEAEGESADVLVKLSWARALAQANRADEAIAAVRRWRANAPAGQELILLRLEAILLREAGRWDEMDRALALLREKHPTSAPALAWIVEERARAGRGADAALDDFLLRAGATAQNFTLVSQPLARIPDVALLQRLIDAARERGLPLRTFQGQLAEAYLRAGDCVAFARTLTALAPQLTTRAERDWRDWLRALSDSLSPTNAISPQPIAVYMQSRLMSLEAYQLTIVALRRSGRDETARDVIELGRRLYSESPSLAAQQAEVTAVLAARSVPAPAALPPAKAEVALPATAEEFLRQVDTEIAAGHWDEAAALLRGARTLRSPPSWLATRDTDLLRREIQIAHGQHSDPALRLATRLYLNGDAARADDVLALAREWRAAGSGDEALRLVGWVVERNPDLTTARSLQQEWQPPPSKATGGAMAAGAKDDKKSE
jgi:tetratricopeptide (TPR) repeat protein